MFASPPILTCRRVGPTRGPRADRPRAGATELRADRRPPTADRLVATADRRPPGGDRLVATADRRPPGGDRGAVGACPTKSTARAAPGPV